MIKSDILKFKIAFILRYIVIAVGVMFLLNIVANNRLPYYVTILFSILFGLLLGLYQVFLGFEFLKKVPFVFRLLVQVVTVQLLIMATIMLSSFILKQFGINVFETTIFELLFAAGTLFVYVKTQIFAMILIFFKEMETLLGKQFLRHYIFDTYRNPVTENRLVLFMDLRNSTAIAEKIGDTKYFHLLNDCYSLLNLPVFSTGAEVLKYVGDEVVLSWHLHKGPKAKDAVRFYSFFKNQLEQKRQYFLRKYGEFPQFAVGIHQGEVVTAYLGDIKKQLDLSGDLMNTTSRICGKCAGLGQEVLVSEDIFKDLDSKSIEKQAFDNVILRGKTDSIRLYSIQM